MLEWDFYVKLLIGFQFLQIALFICKFSHILRQFKTVKLDYDFVLSKNPCNLLHEKTK